jgi:hypothetical protein
MHLDPIRNAAANIANFFSAGIWPDQGVDDGTGLLMPALAGIAAGVTVALMLAIYFQTGYRSYRDMIRHGLAAALGLSLLAFVVYDMRNAALAYLVKTSVGPATEFELRWQQTTERARTLATEMDRHTSAEMDRHVKDLPEPHQG